MLCSVPSFRAIKKMYPSAQITLIGLPSSRDFAKRFPQYIDDFIAFPGYPGLREQEFNSGKFMRFLKKISAYEFDLLIQMHGRGEISNGITSLFNSRHTAGFYSPNEEETCPGKKTYIPYPHDLHETNKQLELVKHLGIPADRVELEFKISPRDLQNLAKIARANKLHSQKYVCINPGSSSSVSWDPYKFAKVADRLSSMGFKVVLTGVKSVRKATKAISRVMKSPSIDLAGQTDLGTLAALLKKSYLLVANDTGVSHLAAALKVPSVTVFTSHDPNIWAPHNKKLHRSVSPQDAYDPINVLHEVSSIM